MIKQKLKVLTVVGITVITTSLLRFLPTLLINEAGITGLWYEVELITVIHQSIEYDVITWRPRHHRRDISARRLSLWYGPHVVR